MHSELGLCLFGMTLMYSTEHRPRQSSTRFYIKSRPPPHTWMPGMSLKRAVSGSSLLKEHLMMVT